MEKRVLALDVGDRTCGVAASDELGLTAQPLKTLRYKNPAERKALFDELARIVSERRSTTIVVGLPVNMNGTEGPQAGKVRDFVAALKERLFKLKVDPERIEWIFWDERLSTSGAERALIQADVSRAKRKNVIDTMAAVFILQGYLAATEGTML